eukprot:4155441-Ditylum_brightwellii.AAC.1
MSDAQSSKSNQNNATTLSISDLSNDTDLVSKTSSSTKSDIKQSKNNNIDLPPLHSIRDDKVVIRKFKGWNTTKALANVSRGGCKDVKNCKGRI